MRVGVVLEDGVAVVDQVLQLSTVGRGGWEAAVQAARGRGPACCQLDAQPAAD